jgi:predicted TIM-barrel fold metal-dependent hydrolase
VSDDFVVSGDGHLIEPMDLFQTRLPKHLREQASWEEAFETEPMGTDGWAVTEWRTLHTEGFEGYTVSCWRHRDGTPNTGDPDRILEDMDYDGIAATLLHPNLSLHAFWSDSHELSLAHCKVYNDYLAERFLPYKERIRPTCPVPLTDIDDAVAEIERVANLGLAAIMLPTTPPKPYYSEEYDRVWAALEAAGIPATFHAATGGHGSFNSHLLKAMVDAGRAANLPVDRRLLGERLTGAAAMSQMAPATLIAQLIGGGVPERHPNLHFLLIEFNAHWLASAMGAMDKAWTAGIGQDPDWWLGYWDQNRAEDDQPAMGKLFALNSKWPYPLRPSEYVQRQFHVAFQDDPTAIACRYQTGISTLLWGNDYPHAEGTFGGGHGPHSPDLIPVLFAGVPDDERRLILGGTLGGLVGFEPEKAKVGAR